MKPELDALAARQGGVFSAHQARGLGLTVDDLRRRRTRGDLHALRRGIFTTVDRVDGVDASARHRVDIAGAMLARRERRGPARVAPDGLLAAGHRSAGLLWALPAPLPPIATAPTAAAPTPLDPAAKEERGGSGQLTPPRLVELISGERGRRSYRYGVHVRPAVLPLDHVVLVEAIHVTTRVRTAVDLMRELTWEEAIIVADASLRAGVGREDLLAMAAFCAAWPGGRQAAEAAEFANAGAESPAESLARLVFAGLGLPAAELQAEIRDSAGFIGRVDFCFRAQRTIVEIDGRIKYTDPHGRPDEVVWREKLREDRLREAGWEVVRVTWAQLMNAKADVKARILAAFARAERRTA